jgi:PKD repeat protein
MKESAPPPLTGPSEFATSITVEITPDQLQQDGASRAEVKITVRDANGAPPRERVELKLEQFVDNVRNDIGTFSPSTVWTGSDGIATSVFTAPSSQTFRVLEIRVTPVGSNFSNAVARVATLRLVPPGVIRPPSGINALFTFSPSAPAEDQAVFFDAGPSAPHSAIVSYQWNFGDGQSGSGRTITHTYRDAGTFFATLTLSDEFGVTVSSTQTITVSPIAGPTADFVFSPTAPIASQPVNFNASASRPPAGGAIASYDWDFGDGTFGTGQTTSHAYAQNGGYTVTLTVTDSNGRTATKSNTITVGQDAPTPDFTVSPTAPTTATNVTFDATPSTAMPGRTITTYTWSFGDGTTGSGRTVTRLPYATPGTYTVTLTVVDSVGKSGSTSKTVTVSTP